MGLAENEGCRRGLPQLSGHGSLNVIICISNCRHQIHMLYLVKFLNTAGYFFQKFKPAVHFFHKIRYVTVLISCNR